MDGRSIVGGDRKRRLGEAGSVAPSLDASASETARAQSLLGRVSQTRWLPTEAAAAYLGLSVPTLHSFRWGGVGPASHKIGRRVVYAQQDLDAWMAGRASAAA